MINVKSAAASAAKYATNGQNAVPAYKSGVQANNNQNANAIAAIPTWQAAVASTEAASRMASGLTKAGQQGWQNGALNKGANNYANGVKNAQNKWQTNTTPYLNVIAGLTLQPKGVKGSQANLANVATVDNALHAAKVAASGG
jgi:hypothetical protein